MASLPDLFPVTQVLKKGLTLAAQEHGAAAKSALLAAAEGILIGEKPAVFCRCASCKMIEKCNEDKYVWPHYGGRALELPRDRSGKHEEDEVARYPWLEAAKVRGQLQVSQRGNDDPKTILAVQKPAKELLEWAMAKKRGGSSGGAAAELKSKKAKQ